MNPKEKAQEILDKFNGFKTFAIITVDEIINSEPLAPNYVDWDDCGASHQYWYSAQKQEALEFWNDVKKEIEKL